MAADEKWYFTKEQLTNTPSRRCGIDADKELSYRQQAANFIQDMGQRLVVSQLCINTAIVYMHRFYVFHSLSQFHRNAIATAALFLAAKVEEQPRKLEHVIKVAHMCLHREQPPPDTRSEQYLEQAQDLVFNENVLLQTLGFDVAIDHPHTHVVRCCQLVKASKDLAQTSYFMASNSLHLTTMCLQYKPTVVACFCIHLACKWSNWEIPQSNEGKHWFWYVDRSVTSELLQQLTAEFLHIFDKCPSRLKRKIMSISANQSPNMNHPSLPNSPFDAEPRKVQSPATASAVDGSVPTFHSSRPHHTDKQEEKKSSISNPTRPPVDYREYREKKERERLEREKAIGVTAATPVIDQNRLSDVSKHHSHHHKVGGNVVSKHSVAPGHKAAFHHNHHRTSTSGNSAAGGSNAEVKQSTGQSVPGQRHPSNSQQSRDPNREANRPRLPSSMHTHTVNYGIHQPLKESGMDHGAVQEASLHGNVQDKLGSNNHGTVHKISAVSDAKHQSHDKRNYDPRHKVSMSEHNRKESEQKIYSNKYSDAQSKSSQGQRKLDTLEQRSEEVRKLIEKPLPPLKQPALHAQHGVHNNMSTEIQKQSHHHKYPQADKTQQNNTGASITNDGKHIGTSVPSSIYLHGQQSPTPVGSLQAQHKSTSSKVSSGQHPMQSLSQMIKDSVKNGNSQQSVFAPLNNVPDDSKIDKRLRTDDQIERSPNIQQNSLQTPPGRHKSLFSPEKVSVNREVYSQRSVKSKQKTPPIMTKVPKQERQLDVSTGLNVISPFTSPTHVQQQYDSSALKRAPSDLTNVSHKRHRSSSVSDVEQQVHIKTEDKTGFDTMKMIGRVPEMIQPIRDNPCSIDGAKNNSLAADSKAVDMLKPYDTDHASQQYQLSQHGSLSNGFNPASIKQEPPDFHSKTEIDVPIKVEPGIVKSEYTTSIKTAQSISALLQEHLAPMPSLLQGMQQYSQVTQAQQPHHIEQSQQQEEQEQQRSLPHSLLQPDYHASVQSECVPLSSTTTIDNPLLVSTVDTSALTVPAQSTSETLLSTPILSSAGNVEISSGTVASTMVPTTEEKKSEHHKSEKKKKEKKHKHKDKDKSKEKHKHKHKDKDKEKHRDKDKERDKEKEKEKSEEAPGPIKITIPKDKLNLSTEGASSNSASSGLKIKIPKERLKAAGGPQSSTVTAPEGGLNSNQQVVQAPLKIKISRSGAQGVTPSVGSTEHAAESRKRDRAELINNSPTGSASAVGGVGPPPSKKQLQATTMGFAGSGQYHHRPSERQNGRHYSGINNEVRGGGGGGRGARHYGGRSAIQRDGYYHQQQHQPQDTYGSSSMSSSSSSGSIARDSQHPHQSTSLQRHRLPPPMSQTVANDVGYYFTNFPPPNMYCNPATGTAAGYMYDAGMYYQQYQQQQQHHFSMYPAGNVIMTPDGAIDTSVPPPSLQPPLPTSNQQQAVRQDPVNPNPPLPSGPPPESSPPPPPPPLPPPE